MNLPSFLASNFLGLLVAFLLVAPFEKAYAQQTKSATNTRDAYAPFEEVLQITASDVTTYDPPLRGCIVETAGDLTITPIKNASSVTITVIAGQLIPAMISKVNTSTTATIVCGR